MDVKNSNNVSLTNSNEMECVEKNGQECFQNNINGATCKIVKNTESCDNLLPDISSVRRKEHNLNDLNSIDNNKVNDAQDMCESKQFVCSNEQSVE